jgi:hypothetical protein
MTRILFVVFGLWLGVAPVASAQGDFYSAPYLCSLNPDGTVTIQQYEAVPVGAVTVPSTIEGFVVTGRTNQCLP